MASKFAGRTGDRENATYFRMFPAMIHTDWRCFVLTVLFAQTDSGGGGPSGAAMFVGGGILLLVSWWLYRIGFFGRFFKAAAKSAAVMAIGGVGIGILAGFAGKGADLGTTFSANTQGLLIFLLIVFLGLTVFFYRKSPPSRDRADEHDLADDYDVERAESEKEKSRASSGHCRKCKGTGEVTEKCQACGGAGESRCMYEERWANWFSTGSTVTARCAGGIVKFGNGQEKYCPDCNGRGFFRCTACAGRGQATVTCKRCGGEG